MSETWNIKKYKPFIKLGSLLKKLHKGLEPKTSTLYTIDGVCRDSRNALEFKFI